MKRDKKEKTGTTRTFSRRDFLRLSALGVGALTFGNRQLLHSAPVLSPPKAKSVIFIWLAGGPSHLDTFDPKPKAGKDYSGPYRSPVATTVDHLFIGEKLPLLAKQATKFSLIRSMTHGHFGHETASYVMQTGTLPGGQLTYPSLGAVVAYKKEKEYKGTLPAYITLPGPAKRFNEGGFLGARYKPFGVGGDPSGKNFKVEGLVNREITPSRMSERKTLLKALDTFAQQMGNSGAIQDFSLYQEQAFNLITGEAKKAFDLTTESEVTRTKYGHTTLGQSCLLARKLVEHGVPFITVRSNGWDTHKQHFERMNSKLPELDQSVATLLEDLDQRGLLEETMVICGGEFGRSPRVLWEPPWNGGRSHFGTAFSYLVAGGGFKAGEVLGKTDSRGENIIERPVSPWELAATIYHLLGIAPDGTLPHPREGLAYVLPELAKNKNKSGLITELLK